MPRILLGREDNFKPGPAYCASTADAAGNLGNRIAMLPGGIPIEIEVTLAVKRTSREDLP